MNSHEEDGSTSPELRPTDYTGRRWPLFGTRVPKTEIVFFTQTILVYTVVLWSFYNLTTNHDNPTLWTSLLSSCLGYLLPSPSLKHNDI